MPQFSVHRNPNPASSRHLPYLLDVQNDLLDTLATRVVVPLCDPAALPGAPVKNLMPLLEVAGKSYVMLTPQLAGIPRKQLGTPVADLSAARESIVAALDLLISGI